MAKIAPAALTDVVLQSLRDTAGIGEVPASGVPENAAATIAMSRAAAKTTTNDPITVSARS